MKFLKTVIASSTLALATSASAVTVIDFQDLTRETDLSNYYDFNFQGFSDRGYYYGSIGNRNGVTSSWGLKPIKQISSLTSNIGYVNISSINIAHHGNNKVRYDISLTGSKDGTEVYSMTLTPSMIFKNAPESNLFNLGFTEIDTLSISYSGVSSSINAGIWLDNVIYTPYVSAVPEPSTYALMLGGLGLVGFIVSRRKK